MSIYQHFRREEKEFIDQVLQWRESVERTYVEKLTDFLDPREQFIVQSIIGTQGDVKCRFFGGTKNAERQRAILYPQFSIIENDDFQLTLFEINYPEKFVKIGHKQVLGSLMSLGVTRGKFGDILFAGERIQFFSTSELKDYIELEFQSIGRNSISLTALPFHQAIDHEEEWQEHHLTASSLRVDVLISSFFRLSRQKSQLFIQKGLVKVNWKKIEQPSFECDVGDVISVRKAGRAKIISLEGKTKKDRWQLFVGIQK